MHSGRMMLLSQSFRRKHKRNIYNIALLFLLTCCFVTLLVNFLHGSMISSLSYSSTHQHLMLDSIHHAKNAPTKQQQQQRQKSAPLLTAVLLTRKKWCTGATFRATMLTFLPFILPISI